MTKVLFWDIDGTLLYTGRAGILALEDAAREVCGVDVSFEDLKTAGLPDHGIAVMAIEAVGATADPPTVEAFVCAYEQHLPDRLHARRGRVMPEVVNLLEAFGDGPEALSLLLTGNTAAGARAKLRHYGLDHLIADGAFSTEPLERSVIARRALTVAADRLGHPVQPEDAYVIGDTPHDVECGHVIGARTLAVATGAYSLEELRAFRPWCALESLPEPAAFADLLGLRRAA